MTADRFDDLTRWLATGTSRRGMLKGMAAVALGSVAARVRGGGGGNAQARARISMACARLGQPCNTVPGTPGNQICCPRLTCGDDLLCCKGDNDTCLDDDDCCGSDNVCRPNPTGLGCRCLPPGAVGAECVEDEDCLSGLACSVEFGACGVICGANVCGPDETCDPYTLTCAGACLADREPCDLANPGACCSRVCSVVGQGPDAVCGIP